MESSGRESLKRSDLTPRADRARGVLLVPPRWRDGSGARPWPKKLSGTGISATLMPRTPGIRRALELRSRVATMVDAMSLLSISEGTDDDGHEHHVDVLCVLQKR